MTVTHECNQVQCMQLSFVTGTATAEPRDWSSSHIAQFVLFMCFSKTLTFNILLRQNLPHQDNSLSNGLVQPKSASLDIDTDSDSDSEWQVQKTGSDSHRGQDNDGTEEPQWMPNLLQYIKVSRHHSLNTVQCQFTCDYIIYDRMSHDTWSLSLKLLPLPCSCHMPKRIELK